MYLIYIYSYKTLKILFQVSRVEEEHKWWLMIIENDDKWIHMDTVYGKDVFLRMLTRKDEKYEDYNWN